MSSLLVIPIAGHGCACHRECALVLDGRHIICRLLIVVECGLVSCSLPTLVPRFTDLGMRLQLTPFSTHSMVILLVVAIAIILISCIV